MHNDENSADSQIVDMLASGLAGEGVLARVRLGASRDAVLMAAIVARLRAEPGLRALVVALTDHEVAGLKNAFDAAGRAAGVTAATLGRDGAPGEAAAVIGSIDTIAARVAAGGIDARSFGLVAIADIDGMADIASAAMLRRALGPGLPGRHFVAFATEPGPAHSSLARDLGGDIAEIDLEAGSERVRAVAATTVSVRIDDKARLLFGLLQRESARPVAVFCNLRDTAESTARLLRARGIKTEYILGNLPRKRALLDSVVAGTFEVLVLTDEGADGLPGGWAASIVNWDLPLEGEPYLARLEHLRADEGNASVFNFACERYSVGLPAIERVLGTRLEPEQPDASWLAPLDNVQQGSGPRVERPQDEQPRDNRPHDARPRGPERKRPDDRRDRGDQYDGRNAKAIQADIAAITGGKVSAPAPSERRPGNKPGKKRGGGTGRAAATTPTERSPERGQPRPAGGKAQPKRQPASARASARSGGRSGGGKGQPGPRISDPYSVSMEERLRMYRERYGSTTSGGGRQGTGKKQPRQRGPEARTPAPASAVEPSSGAEPKPKPAARGLVGVFKGLFGGKDERSGD